MNDEQHLIRDKEGQPLEIVGSWSDITERKAAEEAQAAAQQRLARLLSSSPAVIYSFKATGDFAPTFISENIRTVFGYEPGEYLEHPLLARPRPPRRPDPRRGGDFPIFPEWNPHGGVSLSPQGWLLLLGQ